MNDDLIKRQLAINALENTECELLAEEWNELTNAIRQVPAYERNTEYADGFIDGYKAGAKDTEPKIIKCEDCKNYYPDEDGRGYHCERDSNVRFSVHKDFYCADAERRTDE